MQSTHHTPQIAENTFKIMNPRLMVSHHPLEAINIFNKVENLYQILFLHIEQPNQLEKNSLLTFPFQNTREGDLKISLSNFS